MHKHTQMHAQALACINACTHMYIPTCRHTYPYKCTNAHVQMLVHISTRTHSYMHRHSALGNINTHTHTHTRHLGIYKCTHACARTHTHTHTHSVHAQTNLPTICELVQTQPAVVHLFKSGWQPVDLCIVREAVVQHLP